MDKMFFFSTLISGYLAGYPVICRIFGQRRIFGRIPDIRHKQLAGIRPPNATASKERRDAGKKGPRRFGDIMGFFK